MPQLPLFDAATLKALASQARPTACRCALRPTAGWDSFTEDCWPREQMQPIGTLRDPAVYEPTTDEHHPNGTRYDAADAPLAVAFFPCNRSDIHACSACQQVVLRYTEFGGYYVDHRIRELDEALIVDTAPPAAG